MNFRKATDILFAPVSHADLAETLDVSIALIRQARLGDKSAAHRSPPTGWERAVADLAYKRASSLRRLSEQLRRQ